ncbi:hypothetical protein [uncultured Roseobacter sp.]|uniref:hypothetical protein n=1 Tax=uncultured Roseobacter sp. TaxID=114847 RepID=UPI00260BEA90|nr:hypothetical protein [uncultured Roseobacter sp.]
MYTFSRQDQAELLAEARDRTDTEGFMKDAWALGVYLTETEELCAIAVFQNITTAGAEVHFAGVQSGWNNSRVMRSLYRYAFDPKMMAYPMLTAIIPEHRTDVQIFALKNGFRFDGRRRAGAKNGFEVVIMTMTPDECRLLPPSTPVELVLDEENFAKGA